MGCIETESVDGSAEDTQQLERASKGNCAGRV